MRKNFAVTVVKGPLSRKKNYVLCLDFKTHQLIIIKSNASKRTFDIAQCVRMEKNQGNEVQLELTFGHENPYRKVVYFQHVADRDLFCSLVHSAIITGPRAFQVFKELDLDGDGHLGDSEFEVALSRFGMKTDDAHITDKGGFVNFLAFLTTVGEGLKSAPTTKTVSEVDTSVTSVDSRLPGSVQASPQSEIKRRSTVMEQHPAGPTLRLLDGEKILQEYSHTSRLDVAATRGILYLTNYRLVYQDYQGVILADRYRPHPGDFSAEMPLGAIARIEKDTRVETAVLIYCKDYRVLRFGFDANPQWINTVIQVINGETFKSQEKLFCFSHQLDPPEPAKNGWLLYDPMQEFQHSTLHASGQFRLTEVNAAFKMSDSYPTLFVVPRVVSDDELMVIGSYRSRGRVPAVCWMHPKTKATLSRCSQPLAGIRARRCEEDEKYLSLLRTCNPTNQKVLYIVDARPYKAALGNSVMGKGYESETNYENCVLKFMSIDNIHNIRESLDKLMELCTSGSATYDDTTWLSKLEQTLWLHYVRVLLDAAVTIASYLTDEGASVVTHCSDGWDRTSQLVSLAQMLLDPHYRTIKGFAILIEKEWLSFGHKFAERYGHGNATWDDPQRAPIFLHFLDTVWQIIHQFPTSFEFNETMLMFLADHVMSCRFGTFMFNSPMERSQHSIDKRTPSIWTYIMADDNIWQFCNPCFVPDARRLIPVTQAKRIALWERYHCRWNLAETGEAFRDVPDYVAVETLMRMMFLQQELSKHADVDADGLQPSAQSPMALQLLSAHRLIQGIKEAFTAHRPWGDASLGSGLPASRTVQYSRRRVQQLADGGSGTGASIDNSVTTDAPATTDDDDAFEHVASPPNPMSHMMHHQPPPGGAGIPADFRPPPPPAPPRRFSVRLPAPIVVTRFVPGVDQKDAAADSPDSSPDNSPGPASPNAARSPRDPIMMSPSAMSVGPAGVKGISSTGNTSPAVGKGKDAIPVPSRAPPRPPGTAAANGAPGDTVTAAASTSAKPRPAPLGAAALAGGASDARSPEAEAALRGLAGSAYVPSSPLRPITPVRPRSNSGTPTAGNSNPSSPKSGRLTGVSYATVARRGSSPRVTVEVPPSANGVAANGKMSPAAAAAGASGGATSPPATVTPGARPSVIAATGQARASVSVTSGSGQEATSNRGSVSAFGVVLKPVGK